MECLANSKKGSLAQLNDSPADWNNWQPVIGPVDWPDIADHVTFLLPSSNPIQSIRSILIHTGREIYEGKFQKITKRNFKNFIERKKHQKKKSQKFEENSINSIKLFIVKKKMKIRPNNHNGENKWSQIIDLNFKYSLIQKYLKKKTIPIKEKTTKNFNSTC